MAHASGDSLNTRLLRLYEPLAARTAETCARGDWPATSGVRRGLVRGPEGTLSPVRFDDGQGPVGVAAFPAALATVGNSVRQHVFNPLIERLNAALQDEGCGQLSVWWAPDYAMHFTIFQFTEHPVLMQEEERARCRPLSDADDEMLRGGLAEAMPQLVPASVVLHGARLMPDGSMLLLYLESPAAEGTVDQLRSACSSVAHAAGQSDQPVRPKDFLHVVVGRILEIPTLSDEQRKHLQELAAAEALTIGNMEPVECLEIPTRESQQIDIGCVQLVRDKQWFHLEYDCLGSFPIGPSL